MDQLPPISDPKLIKQANPTLCKIAETSIGDANGDIEGENKVPSFSSSAKSLGDQVNLDWLSDDRRAPSSGRMLPSKSVSRECTMQIGATFVLRLDLDSS